MSRHTKEKRKKQKLKLEAEVKKDNLVFDVLSLLKTELLDTKPNIAKFLKQYVKSITGCPKVKPTFYPVFELRITKYFIKFLDGHEIVFDQTQRNKEYRYIFCYELQQKDLNAKDMQLIEDFVKKLQHFNFIPGQDEVPEVVNIDEQAIEK